MDLPRRSGGGVFVCAGFGFVVVPVALLLFFPRPLFSAFFLLISPISITGMHIIMHTAAAIL